jgi:hypothetical protein
VEGHGADPVNGQSGERPLSPHDDFEILKESPMLGDGKFKLEIGTCAVRVGFEP